MTESPPSSSPGQSEPERNPGELRACPECGDGIGWSPIEPNGTEYECPAEHVFSYEDGEEYWR